MLLNECNSHGPHESGSSLPTALQLVSALTGEQHQRLRAFAAKRLRRLQQPRGHNVFGRTPDDVVHDALQKILLGDSHAKHGRKLSVKNREDTGAFLRCLMGIINSDLSNAIKSAEFSFPHLPLADGSENASGVELPDPGNVMRQLEQRDLQGELFRRLRQQAATELQPIIEYWEPRYLTDDCIARKEFDRRRVHRVRTLAREILRQLAGELGPSPVHGMEMVR